MSLWVRSGLYHSLLLCRVMFVVSEDGPARVELGRRPVISEGTVGVVRFSLPFLPVNARRFSFRRVSIGVVVLPFVRLGGRIERFTICPPLDVLHISQSISRAILVRTTQFFRASHSTRVGHGVVGNVSIRVGVVQCILAWGRSMAGDSLCVYATQFVFVVHHGGSM